jgi:hypothetical protein
MTFRMLYAADMKTESEFADAYLGFIREYGISYIHILMFYRFEPVLYLDPVSKFQYPETKERP